MGASLKAWVVKKLPATAGDARDKGGIPGVGWSHGGSLLEEAGLGWGDWFH